MLGGDALGSERQLNAAGEGPWAQEPARRGLRVARLPASAATPKGLLAPPLRSLAAKLRPTHIVVDAGGMGQCGPNVGALLLGLLGLFSESGADLRLVLVEYGRRPAVQALQTAFHSSATHATLSMGELMVESMRNWPADFCQGRSPSVDAWLDIVAQPAAWTDIAFVQLLAAHFAVVCALTGVDDLGEVFPLIAVEPLGGQEPLAWLDFGCWVNRHFVAIVRVEPDQPPASGHAQATGGSPPPLECTFYGCPPCGGTGYVKGEPCWFCAEDADGSAELAEWAEFQWPLKTVEDFQRLLQCQHIRPEALVAFEFSGAMRRALESRGVRAISVDRRECDIGGMHFQGDVREVAHLQHWKTTERCV